MPGSRRRGDPMADFLVTRVLPVLQIGRAHANRRFHEYPLVTSARRPPLPRRRPLRAAREGVRVTPL
jgi:hypothetical protein